MSDTLTPPGDVDLEAIEQHAAEHLAEGGLDAPVVDPRSTEPAEPEAPVLRLSLAVGATTLAAAVMAGGVFTGISPRPYAAIAGVLGIALGATASRIRRPLVSNLAIVSGLFLIGLFTLALTGPDHLTQVSSLVQEASKAGNVLRPPVKFDPGWAAILGWLMAAVGFGAIWTATALRKPALAILVPIPVVGIAAISVPKDQQLASGLVALVLFAIGLGLLSTAQNIGEEDQRPPLSYELRRAVRSLPLIAVITLALYAAAQTNFLFPKPLVDPTQQPQKPKTVPLSKVKDQVLFEVSNANVPGPWRTGSLDEYDGKDWRLPPFSENRLDTVPKTGIVTKDLQGGTRATFKIVNLNGAVLPGLPNIVGVKAQGPRLAYDARNGNLRVDQGQITPGLTYTVVGAGYPAASELENLVGSPPAGVRRFLDIPPAPPAVEALLAQAPPDASPWHKLAMARTTILSEVVAAGEGTPVSVTPQRVQEMLTTKKEATPFEIVAAQAMVARWAGVPSRIGYGFDRGQAVEGHIEVRPKNGATFLEVYFEGYGWVPLSGDPAKAKPTVGDNAQKQQAANVQASADISVKVYLPVVLPLRNVFGSQVVRAILILGPLFLLLLLGYLLLPVAVKAWHRGRRRNEAESRGARARIANAYAEWRDFATDYGYRYDSDTPLMFLERFADDAEHTELAWLVTRALFGDLRDHLTVEHVLAAEELSRAMRRRLSQAHPATVRAVAMLSRLSLRHPYAPGLRPSTRKERRARVTATVTAPA
jgi:hypothetical protein